MFFAVHRLFLLSFCLYIFISLAPVAAATVFLLFALFFFAEGGRRVCVCVFQYAFVAGAAFAAGVAGAEGAAAVLGAGSAIDDGLPNVSVLTLPPHFPAAAGEDVVGGKGAI